MAITTVDGSFITDNTVDGTKLALASQAAGDVMYYNGTDWIRLAKGTADQILTMNDGATAPGWETAAAGGITDFDMWRLNTTFTGDANPIASNLERVDTVFEHIGTGMSQSSGIFTFPSTGKWLISFQINQFLGGAENRVTQNFIQATTDNSSYVSRAEAQIGTFQSSSSNSGNTGFCQMLFDVTSTTTHKVRFDVTAVNNSSTTYGETNLNATSMSFMKLGDT